MDSIIEWINNDTNFRRTTAALTIVFLTVAAIMTLQLYLASKRNYKVVNNNNGSSLGSMEDEENETEDDDLAAVNNLLDVKNDPDILFGSTDVYDWSQTDTDIEMYIKLNNIADSSKVRAKDVNVIITSNTITISAQGVVLVKGDLFARVLADDCTWQIDEKQSGERVIWVTLFKTTPTQRNQHWKSVVKGDSEINVAQYGPPVHGIDTADPNSVRKAIKTVSTA